jgi:hypothetical protein
MVSLSQWALDLTGKPPTAPAIVPMQSPEPLPIDNLSTDRLPQMVQENGTELLALQHLMETPLSGQERLSNPVPERLVRAYTYIHPKKPE